MTNQIVEYLADSTTERPPSHVYLALWPSKELSTTASAIDFLRAKSPPIPLVPVQWGGTLEVVVEANLDPRIWFGCRPSAGNWEADLAQIIRVLRENGIEAELSLDRSQLASQGSSPSSLELEDLE